MSPSSASSTTTHLAQLREQMKAHSLSALYIPSEDAHFNEYIAPRDARRAFISGFTGSAGVAVVTDKEAALWTDGRYFLQAGKQLDPNWKLMKQGLAATPKISDWLVSVLEEGARVGVDATTISYENAKTIKETLAKKSIQLVPTKGNLVDAIWAEARPKFAASPVFHLPVKYSGVSAAEKISSLRKSLEAEGVAGFAATALDDIAWLFNLRGSDIPFNPVFFAYSLVTRSSAALYLSDPSKLEPAAKESLPPGVVVKPYEEFFQDIVSCNASKTLPMWLAPTCNWAIVDRLGAENVRVATSAASPVALAKAVKNQVEQDGFRACHARDAAALCNFFGWLEAELAAKSVVSECDAADRLEAFRAEQEHFVGLSFDTISSVGPNAAIIHYKPEESTCAKLNQDQIFLLDSGGQYLDGTTDVTRTMHFGTPTSRERDAFTRVLLGNLNLERMVFPAGTTGYQLDIVARAPLWQAGLDFGHGTGHGVGHYLNVHEGPQGISYHVRSNEVALRPGMTVTNEPGYYEDNAFGIRIENVLLVREAKLPALPRTSQGFLRFENLTMVPIQASLIDVSLLEQGHVDMLNRYHEECVRKVGPLLKPGSPGHAWLERNARPLSK